MPALQHRHLLSSEPPAMEQLQAFLRQRRATPQPVAELDAFAQQLHRRFVAAEREALGQALSRFALDVPAVEGEGERDPRVLRCATTSTRALGPVRVERRVDRCPQGDHALCPLARRAGIIAGSWTP
jgi:hypothetical protein